MTPQDHSLGSLLGGLRAAAGAEVEPPPAGELLGVIRLLEARDLDHVAGMRSVDELVASERDSDVVHIPGRFRRRAGSTG